MNTKLFQAILLGGFCLASTAASAAQTAGVQMFNTSIHIYPGKCDCGMGLNFYLHFSSLYTEEVWQANGEVSPLPQPASATHESWLLLEDVSMSTAVTPIKLNLPQAPDNNGDGLPDFFDVRQGVSVGTTGTYGDIWGLGQENPISAVWFRTAGVSQGSCDITLHDPMLGILGPFHHTFEIIHYAGTLSYTPGSEVVAGTILLVQTGNPTSQVQGPVQFLKSPANPLNVLKLQDGTWNRTDTGPFAFIGGTFTRSTSHPDTYGGTAQSPDGYYRSWTLSIQDTHDANGNGIPDFSDAVAITPPRPPQLSITRTSGNLQLRIAGDVGRLHHIQEALSPAATNWATIQSVTLTNDPQVVSLPLPIAATFWRVKAE